MSAERIAQLIPPEYRKEILELNMIDTAIAQHTDTTMHYLAVVWKNYIEKDFKAECNFCLARVLKNMKSLKPILIRLELESKLLKQVGDEQG
jgi:hypothetical protein